MAITDFLKTTTSRKELTIALKVLRQFKECESPQEYLCIPFAAWAKFEQMEEFLSHICEGTELQEDTKQYMKDHP